MMLSIVEKRVLQRVLVFISIPLDCIIFYVNISGWFHLSFMEESIFYFYFSTFLFLAYFLFISIFLFIMCEKGKLFECITKLDRNSGKDCKKNTAGEKVKTRIAFRHVKKISYARNLKVSAFRCTLSFKTVPTMKVQSLSRSSYIHNSSKNLRQWEEEEEEKEESRNCPWERQFRRLLYN